MTNNFALGLKYLGTHYAGWQKQKQKTADTIQQRLEDALSRIANTSIQTVCAGRTDRGVHATNQVVNFQTDIVRNTRAWTEGVNRYLPTDIVVSWVKEVDLEFHARFSAQHREYRYVICNQSTPILLSHQCHRYAHPLDISRMQQASSFLLGEHDFTTFRGPHCQARHAVRHVIKCEINRYGNCIYIDIAANSFLHHMVRYIVGCLLTVGNNQQPVSWIQEILMRRQRASDIPKAPACGLYLTDVGYSSVHLLPITRMAPEYLVI